jgi:hypothetical protein
MLVEVEGIQQMIELFRQPADRSLATIKPGLFGHAAGARSQQLVSAFNDLQWLAKIMPCHAKKHSLKLAGALQVHGTVAG